MGKSKDEAIRAVLSVYPDAICKPSIIFGFKIINDATGTELGYSKTERLAWINAASKLKTPTDGKE